jgi:hypothetical protein
MSKEPIFKDFDLPTMHLPDGEHYVPRKARSQAEIERRRALPAGSLMADLQYRGTKMAQTILEHVQEPDDISFSARLLAVSGINSAWYSFAQNAEVMRRRLKLPLLIHPNILLRPNSGDVMHGAQQGFAGATLDAKRLSIAVENETMRVGLRKRQLGKSLGNSSLKLACVSLGDQVVADSTHLTDASVQILVRQRCLDTLKDSRTLGEEIGTCPSIAQLADPDSDLSVHWRRNAPPGAYEAYEQAAELMPLAV